MSSLVNPLWSKDRRRELRSAQTNAERCLWDQLRDRRCHGIKFRRQVGVGPYIVDFYAHDLRLAIEVDGKIHDGSEAKEYDGIRDEYLKKVGVRVLRFTNEQIFGTMQEVLIRIGSERPSPRSGEAR